MHKFKFSPWPILIQYSKAVSNKEFKIKFDDRVTATQVLTRHSACNSQLRLFPPKHDWRNLLKPH